MDFVVKPVVIAAPASAYGCALHEAADLSLWSAHTSIFWSLTAVELLLRHKNLLNQLAHRVGGHRTLSFLKRRLLIPTSARSGAHGPQIDRERGAAKRSCYCISSRNFVMGLTLKKASWATSGQPLQIV